MNGVCSGGSSSGESSRVLQSIVGGDPNKIKEFWERVWQNECKVYRHCHHHCDYDSPMLPEEETTPPSEDTNTTSDEHMMMTQQQQQSPLEELITNAWPALLSLLQNAQCRFNNNDNNNDDDEANLFLSNDDNVDADSIMVPLLFRQGQVVDSNVYGCGNLFAAYLDGCSVILNHADWTCPYMAKVCQDLQQSFPHVYANSYLTPPASQAVLPHADDRDVLVIQLVGKKHWKVYKNVPIPYPYSHEQVGKNGFDVPDDVLRGPVWYDTILNAGDVLYMPRGHVHQAWTLPTDLSFHVTIAIPTHDWTLGHIVTAATQHVTCNMMECRRAVPLHMFGNSNSSNNNINNALSFEQSTLMEEQVVLENILARIRQEITVHSIREHLQSKMKRHNRRAYVRRMACIKKAAQTNHNNKDDPTTTTTTTTEGVVVGPEAARLVTAETIVRASTAEEKKALVVGVVTTPASLLNQHQPQQPRGLHVREETADALLGVLQVLKGDTSKSCRVSELLTLVVDDVSVDKICPLTLVSFARCCVELGGMAVVSQKSLY